MKKTRLHLAIMALSLPLAAFSLGMGDMTVESSLNQPFKAEIPLIDVDIPLAGIKANLASIEDFERIGLDRNEILTLLKFEIKKNAQGKPVIAITSSERIVEPFLEIVVDLAWSNGQLYRAYTVLLDPPGYQLTSTKATGTAVKVKTSGAYSNHPGVVEKDSYAHVVQQATDSPGKPRKEASYGPTVANENIWQIAQRYTTPDTSIQQVILAIVGTNSQAFTQGNLNGLKSGERLRIPSSDEVKKIPADLARKEVAAHDEAWQNKQEIKHVLLPPYIDGVKGSSQFDASTKPTNPHAQTSTLPEAPVIDQESGVQSSFSSILSAADNFITPTPQSNKQAVEPTGKQPATNTNSDIKAELDVNTAAVDSVRLANTQLKSQLKNLQDDNKQLQQKMDQRDKDIDQLRQQIQVILKQRQGVAAQTSAQPVEEESTSLLTYLLLLLGGIGLGAGGLFFWRFYQRDKEEGLQPEIEEPKVIPQVQSPVPVVEDKPEIEESSISTTTVAEAAQTPKIEPSSAEENNIHKMGMLDTNFDQDIADMTAADEIITEPEIKSEEPHLPESFNEEDLPSITVHQTGAQDDKRQVYKRPLSDLAGPAAEQASISLDNDDDMPVSKANQEEGNADDYLLDFEPSLEKIVEKNKQELETKQKPKDHDKEEGIDFVLHDNEKASKPAVSEVDDKVNTKKPEEEEEEEQEGTIEFESAKEIEDMLKEEPDNKPNYASGNVELPTEEITIDSEAAKEIEEILKQSDNEQDNASEKDLLTEENEFDLSSDDNELVLDEEDPTIDIAVDELQEDTESNEDTESATEDKPKLVKSRAALDTLLGLAKTYISMDDLDAARQSLEEVMTYGNKRQQKDAQKLLKDLDKQ